MDETDSHSHLTDHQRLAQSGRHWAAALAPVSLRSERLDITGDQRDAVNVLKGELHADRQRHRAGGDTFSNPLKRIFPVFITFLAQLAGYITIVL
jgi:hypothetical protein